MTLMTHTFSASDGTSLAFRDLLDRLSRSDLHNDKFWLCACSFLVTEGRERVGGNITSVSGNGYLWEEGPSSFQPNDSMLKAAVRPISFMHLTALSEAVSCHDQPAPAPLLDDSRTCGRDFWR